MMLTDTQLWRAGGEEVTERMIPQVSPCTAAGGRGLSGPGEACGLSPGCSGSPDKSGGQVSPELSREVGLGREIQNPRNTMLVRL